MDPTQMQAGAPAAADPTAQPADTSATAPVLTICISQMPDGSFSVYADDESDGESADDESSEGAQGQKAGNVSQALQIAKQLLSAGGAPGAAAGGSDASANALFEQGFNQARGYGQSRGG